MSKQPSSKYIVPSVNKAIDVILLLSQKPNLTLNQIMEALGFPMSTCYNILNTLQNRGIIEKNEQTSQYSLGLALMRLGMEIYDTIDIRKVALPVMKELVNKFGETSYLATMDKNTYEGVVLDKIESLKAVTVFRSIGSRVPLYASATGKSLLTGLTLEELEAYTEQVEFVKFTENTIGTKEELLNQIASIKEKGYAITEDDMGDGVTSISASIKDYQGKVIAAISVAGPTDRMKEQVPSIIPEVKAVAEDLSKQLRY